MKKNKDAVLDIQNELRSVIKELESISEEIKSSQKNIGEYTCSQALEARAEKYRKLVKDLDRIQVREKGNILTWL